MVPWLSWYVGNVQVAVSPLRHTSFRSLVAADHVADIGTYARIVGVTWLLIEQNQPPSVVALAHAANTAPIFLLSVIGGSLADFGDRRLVQLAAQIWIAGTLLILTIVTAAGFGMPAVILLLTFVIGIGTAMRVPAWHAAIRDYVPRQDIPAAVAVSNSASNVSRAIGPVIGGALVVVFSAAGAFLYAAFSALVLVAALYRSPSLPPATSASGVLSGLRSGIDYIRATPAMRTLMGRSLMVCLPGSAGLALLPVVVTDLLGGGPQTFGILLGCFGAGTVLGATMLPAARRSMTPDAVLGAASFCFAVALVILAVSSRPTAAAPIVVFAGASWVGMLSTLTAVAHAVSSEPMRGRAVSAYLTCAFGGISIGSAIWGCVAHAFGVSASLVIAASVLAVLTVLKGNFCLPGHWTATRLGA